MNLLRVSAVSLWRQSRALSVRLPLQCPLERGECARTRRFVISSCTFFILCSSAALNPRLSCSLPGRSRLSLSSSFSLSLSLSLRRHKVVDRPVGSPTWSPPAFRIILNNSAVLTYKMQWDTLDRHLWPWLAIVSERKGYNRTHTTIKWYG